jgi:ubiquinone/menaquinone biosynthesis C-methylase UbiE
MFKNQFHNSLVCPQCHSILSDGIDKFTCLHCKKEYPLLDGIPDFRSKEEYWCNVSKEKMQELNKLAKTSGDWLGAAEKIVPRFIGHFKPFYRADSQFLWPSTEDSRILDAGSMWGGITIPAAQYHREVYAVDKTKETLEFLNIRAKQMGLTNICTVASGLKHLPFSDNFFDLVILNGVLEWVAFDEELILEEHWTTSGSGLKTDKKKKYSTDPRTMQVNVLKELQRVIKPGGALYLAIENSIGYIYLLGTPDDHMNIPFISFMPRFIANAVTNLMVGSDYRTYVYSIPGCKSLFAESNFANSTFYGAFQHYINPSHIIPLDLIKDYKKELEHGKRRLHKLFLRAIPKHLLKWISPSLVAIAYKGSTQNENDPRLIRLLKAAGVIDNNVVGARLVKTECRQGNENTVNFLVYLPGENSPKYFCKVCRKKDLPGIIDTESTNLTMIMDKLKGAKCISSIPKLVYHGKINQISFLVMEYIDSKRAVFNFNSVIKKNIGRLDLEIRMGIDFLAAFQRQTATQTVEAVPYLITFLENKVELLNKNKLLTPAVKTDIDNLFREITDLKSKGLTLPLCAQHGDYDFFYNIQFKNNSAFILDFEHLKFQALPFLDLATLIFNPILVSYEHKCKNIKVAKIIDAIYLKKHLSNWIAYYAKLTGISAELLNFILPISALEQRTMEYPNSRNPETFPINESFSELLSIRMQG